MSETKQQRRARIKKAQVVKNNKKWLVKRLKAREREISYLRGYCSEGLAQVNRSAEAFTIAAARAAGGEMDIEWPIKVEELLSGYEMQVTPGTEGTVHVKIVEKEEKKE